MLFKLGERDVRELPNVTAVLGRRRMVDIRLYGEILRDRPEADIWLPLVIECFGTANRALTRTADGRFEELDTALMEGLSATRDLSDGPLRVNQMGVSDGRTAVALCRRLKSLSAMDYTASDLYRFIFVVRHSRRGRSVACGEDGRAVQYAGWGFVVSPPHPDLAWVDPVNRLVQIAFDRWLRPRAERALAASDGKSLTDLAQVDSGGFRVFRVPLVCRDGLDLRRDDPHFRFVRHDVREPRPGTFGLVRAMNVLNHLDRNDQIRALQNFHASLGEGGVLAVGRSNDPGGATLATICARRGDQLERLRELNAFADLMDVARSLPLGGGREAMPEMRLAYLIDQPGPAGA